VPSERCSIEEQSIEYCDGRVMSSDVVRGDLRFWVWCQRPGADTILR
jgi:hypothetical protein